MVTAPKGQILERKPRLLPAGVAGDTEQRTASNAEPNESDARGADRGGVRPGDAADAQALGWRELQIVCAKLVAVIPTSFDGDTMTSVVQPMIENAPPARRGHPSPASGSSARDPDRRRG
jgi:hypothetical protein